MDWQEKLTSKKSAHYHRAVVLGHFSSHTIWLTDLQKLFKSIFYSWCIAPLDEKYSNTVFLCATSSLMRNSTSCTGASKHNKPWIHYSLEIRIAVIPSPCLWQTETLLLLGAEFRLIRYIRYITFSLKWSSFSECPIIITDTVELPFIHRSCIKA